MLFGCVKHYSHTILELDASSLCMQTACLIVKYRWARACILFNSYSACMIDSQISNCKYINNYILSYVKRTALSQKAPLRGRLTQVYMTQLLQHHQMLHNSNMIHHYAGTDLTDALLTPSLI